MSAALSTWSFFFQAEDGIRDADVTGVQTCALPILEVSGYVHTSRAVWTACSLLILTRPQTSFCVIRKRGSLRVWEWSMYCMAHVVLLVKWVMLLPTASPVKVVQRKWWRSSRASVITVRKLKNAIVTMHYLLPMHRLKSRKLRLR